MAKKRVTSTRRKAKNSNIVYFFLIPALFLLLYVVGQPQTLIQEATEKKAEDAAAAAPTFTSIGDCAANNTCPTSEPQSGGQPVDTDPASAQQHEKKEKKKKESKGDKKTESKKESKSELLARIKDLLKQVTDGKCQGAAERIGANYAQGDDIQANHNKYHRRKKWRNKNKGLLKLLKCLEKEVKEHKPVGGAPGQAPQTPEQDQPSEEPSPEQPQQEEQPEEQQPSEAPAEEPAAAAPSSAPGTVANVSGSCGTVVSKAQQLNDVLQIGSANGRWSKMPQTFSDCNYSSKTWSGTNDATKYWCTYLVVDAYNMAGFKGLSVGAHAAVVNMRSWWKTASGYTYVENKNDQATMDRIGPGYAIFMETQAGVFTGKEHVNIIKTKNVDSRGNGTITTLDSNAKEKGRTYTVTNWTISGTSYPVRGFGGH